MANKLYDLRELQLIRNAWPDIPDEAVPEPKRKIFLARKRAVNLYINGAKLSDIEKQTGVRRGNISRLLKRSLKKKEDGEYYGYEALIPNNKMEEVCRTNTFQNLLERFPSLAEFIYGNFFGNKKYTLEKNMNVKTLHGKFLAECRRLGIQDDEYPFNTANLAYVSLSKHVKKLQKENLSDQARREGKDSVQKLRSTGIGNRYTRDAVAPFQCVQIDGHIIDAHYVVEIENDDGTVSKVIATRAWLIAVIDVATRCILGFSVSQQFNYDQYDVIDALINAIKPKERRKLTIKGLEYPENGGYHSIAFPELKYALFNEVMLDNAKSHLSNYTVEKVSGTLKNVMNFGSVATPETRGIIERFFGSLETRGFHKLPATTGSNIKDPKRHNPESAALKYNITYEEICELLEILIAEYNNTPHSSLFGQTPLEAMKAKIFEAGLVPCLATEEEKSEIDRLRLRTTTRIVRGKAKNGKRPYISFEGAEYRSPELSVSANFLGQELTICFDPRDISTVEAYDEKGNYIGTLRARGEFGTKSHSLKTRKNANRLAMERGRTKLMFDSTITEYENHLNEKGQTNRRDATKADIVRREQGKEKYSERKPADVVHVENKETEEHKYTYEELKDLSVDEVYQKLFGKEA